MQTFESIEKEFIQYNPLVFNLESNDEINILNSTFNVQFSNNICFPEFKLGFHHWVHKTKDKMVLTEEFNNRKKIYLVTSLFEKNIDYKEKTNTGIEFTSINNGIKDFINTIKPDFPPLLNRAFLKMWEILVNFDLISNTENFVSSHLAEGPGSFIQATILYREMLVKLGKIKSCSKDNYYGVTLHSDHEHLHMQQEFINYFSKESPKRLHIMETKSIKELKDMYGGYDKKNSNMSITNGDLTKLNTIKQFAGSKDVESFAKLSDLITADGGFDWKKENLQEQESYKLIFGEIVTALKIQKNGGNFVIKIFESCTKITIKMIEMLRQCYTNVYISKPYASRISNSEKYIVCKDFKKNVITTKIISKLEEQINTINKNSEFQIIDIFTDIILPESIYNAYKQINLILLLKQYVGINDIVKFINLDNYNGYEFNDFLDKQIIAAHFWNKLFLEPKNYNKIYKYFKNFNFIEYKKQDSINTSNNNLISNTETVEKSKLESNTEKEPEIEVKSELKNKKGKMSRTIIKNNTKKKSTKTTKNQKGGAQDSISNDNDSELMMYMNDTSIKSSDNDFGQLNSDDNDFIDLNNL